MTGKALLSTLSLLILFFSASLSAEALSYQEITLKNSRHIEDKVEVALFYDYNDPASSELDSLLNEWLKTRPDQVYFIRRPSINGQKNWALALSYTRAEMLGKGDKVHAALFAALTRIPPGLNSMQELVAFNGEQDINGHLPAHVLQANFKRLSSEWTNNPEITTPSVVVAQKYLITKEIAGSNEAIIKTINKLIGQEKDKQ